MALPRAIQEQVEAADALVAGMNGQTDNPDTDPQPPAPAAQEPEPPTPPVSQEVEPKPAPVPEEKWQHKYLTLKGMYDAEVPRLHAQVRELNQQVQTLIAEAAAAKAKPAPEPTPSKPLITDKDAEAFGSDLLDLIDRATEQKIAGFRDREAQLVSEINELKGKLGNVSERQVMSDKDRFLMALSQQVADWEQMNTDPGFLAWLAEVDPVYGLPRQAALNSAYEAFDAARTANIFRQYKATLAPAPQQQTRQELQRQVAPTRSRASSAPAATADQSRVFTQSEIAQFYEEWRRGLIDNDEAVRMEREIQAAIVAGRIR